jgi:hypothetical protein
MSEERGHGNSVPQCFDFQGTLRTIFRTLRTTTGKIVLMFFGKEKRGEP